jgi:cyclase
MNRTVIIAKILPGAEREVARIFAESDATSLPADIGVTERWLYSLGDAYVHLVDFDRDAADAMSMAQRQRGFHDISGRLSRYVSPYSPLGRSPRDAIATPFYHWASR